MSHIDITSAICLSGGWHFSGWQMLEIINDSSSDAILIRLVISMALELNLASLRSLCFKYIFRCILITMFCLVNGNSVCIKSPVPCFHLPSTLLEGVQQCLVLCLCGNQWLLSTTSAAVSCVHLWPPSIICHDNTLIPVWIHDTNEIGMWKWGFVLWHWVTAGAGSRVQLWGLSLCSAAVDALPALRGNKAHVREDGNSAGECSHWRALRWLQCCGGVLAI